MIEIGGMPILWHIMKNYSAYGYNDFIICAGYKQHVIKDWFADYYINHSDVTFDFTKKAQREHFITYGPFTMKPAEGVLRIGWNKSGFAVFGDEGLTDYALDVTFEIPRKGNGSSGILLRATDVSYYDAQVEDSYFGYAITISEKGVTLKRSRYGAVGSSSFEAVPAWAEATQGSLHIEVRGNRVDVYLPGVDEPLVSLEDAKPLTHGAYGFWSTGKELSVLDCTISPLE
jgi:hypothetical protein